MADKTQIINNQANGANNAKPVASSAPASFAPFFRRRTIGRGRAPSPPTWGCYEQIPLEFTDSEDVDDDEDDEEDDDNDIETDSDDRSLSGSESGFQPVKPRTESPGHAMEMDMDMDMEGDPKHNNAHKGVEKSDRMDVDGETRTDAKHTCGSADGEQCSDAHVSESQKKKQDKGKQRAVEPVSPSEKNENSANDSAKKRQRNGNRNRKRRDRESNHILRPILTIKKSDGFVWNQDLFVPSYIKDRYIASTSPPSSNVASTTSGALTNDFNDNYEIEVVEIRVQGNELEGILS